MNTTTENIILTTLTNGPPQVEKLLFSWFDHSIFGLMLAMSALIGIYFGFFGKKQDNVAEYILGGKEMKMMPVAMSLIASNVSGVTVLAVPADIYSYGASYWLCCISITITGFITLYVYLPVFYKLQLTSTYEYLKLRFDNRCRLLASFLFILAITLYMPILIYVPALAFAQVTNVNIYWVTPLVCIVCIFYTTIGGLKAVIWTDTLQFTIMIGAMILVLILGFNTTGSIASVFQKSYEGGRLNLWDMDPDPTNRTSVWAVIIGLTTTFTSYISVSQGCIQKFLSIPTIGSVRRAIIIFIFGVFFVKSLTCVTGLIMYAKYSECDPLITKQVERQDQLLPHFIMEVAGSVPGLPGIFIAGVFCAALSSMSAGLNCLSGIMYEDFVKRFMPKDTTEKRASDIMKCIVIIVGAFTTSMVFVVEHLGSILPLSLSIGGMVHGPLLGMFTLGVLIPFANSKGALTGAISGLLFIGWINFNAQYYIANGVVFVQKLPTSVESCDFPVEQFLTNSTTPVSDLAAPWLYKISFYYYGLIGLTATVIVGSIVSLLTGGLNQTIDRNLLSPVIYFALPKQKKYEYATVQQAMEIMTKNYPLEKNDDNIYR